MTETISANRPVAASTLDAWDEECDVIVVGFGGAGACAALEAAAAGARVMLLELASGSGGTTALAGGQIYIGGGTPIQKACGFEDSVEAMEAYLRLAAGEGGDEDKVRAYSRDSLEHYDWLVAQGVEFNPEFYGGKHTNTPEYQSLAYSGNEKGFLEAQLAQPAPRAHKPHAFWEEGGATLMQVLTQAVVDAGVDVHYDSRVLTLVVDAGQVVGVLCRQDGAVRALRAKQGVILCSGGFIMNREMVEKYAPRLKDATPIGNPGDTGTGIQMGMGVGGAAVNMDQGFISVLWYPAGEFCEGVFVNAQGLRFINEDCYHARGAHHCLHQTERRAYLVVDSAIFTGPPLYADPPVVEVGETIEELERDAGFAPGTLTQTISTYNRFAAEGQDPLFHKDAAFLRPLDKPPYALLDFTIGPGMYYPAFTFGGLDTTVDGEVRRSDGSTIPGLYAAGRCSAGLPRSGEGYASGMSIGDATYFGRRAGRAAAARATA
ncbi:MAG: FAD-dependent oxidoreductase [Halieaceae bacterium]|jgi:succinate dehydrogenase/fumarate reductase flavoprotein subunit|nr:FAD-dependent oxidoreductase [Halieaceae bacterium]